jgi:O-antigen/teichoic acid export membrane protein
VDNGLGLLGKPDSLLAGSGAIYLAARYGFGVLIGLGNMLVLTWWIGPHAYGLFVTAIGLVAFLSSIARIGVDTYLVRKQPSPDQHTYEVAFTIVLAVSTVLVLFGAAFVPLLARWLGSREFVAPYMVLLVSVPVIALTGIPTAKLERELDFRRLAGIEVVGQLLGLLVSFAMAWRGFGVWAAVAGQTTWQVFLLAAAFRCSRLAPRLALDWPGTRDMLTYGMSVTASLRTWQMRSLVNPLIVGRFAGAEAVAFVALAIRIAESLGSVRQAAGRVAIASFARLQHDRVLLLRTLEKSLYLQVMILGSLLCTFGLVGPIALRFVIGTRWSASLAIYPFVAAGVLINSIYNLQASALFVTGRARVVTQCYLVHVVLLVAGTFLFLPHFGIRGYGWAELLACTSYALIQREFSPSISYRKIVPVLTLFLALIFLSAVVPERIALSVGVLVLCGAGWRFISSRFSRILQAFAARVSGKLKPVAGTFILISLTLLTCATGQAASGKKVPKQTATIPATFFGMHFRLDKIEWPAIPFGSLRLWDTDTSWQRMNPKPGLYDFEMLDRYLAFASKHGVNDVLLNLGGTPGWASKASNDRSCDYSEFAPGSCQPPVDLYPDGSGANRYWREFLHALGSHLAGLDPSRYASVTYFSVWNEFTRGAESRRASWLGTNRQMSRMVADAHCLLIGPPGKGCTPAQMGTQNVAILPESKMTTPDFVPDAAGLITFAEYLKGESGDSIDIVAVHAYAFHNGAVSFPESGPSSLVQQWADLQAILPNNFNQPVWSSEGSWGDTQRNLPDPDMQMAFIARYYLLGWSLGFRRLYWYAAENSWGRLIHQQGSGGCRTSSGCPTPAASAWQQIYRWMVGNRMTQPCAAELGTVWSCQLQKPDGTAVKAVWDISQICNAGICTTAHYRYSADYTGYFTLENSQSKPLSNGTVPVGSKPILLCQKCSD